jgi:hypothetical protein
VDAPRRLVVAALAAALLGGSAAVATDPDQLQGRYDLARDLEERELARAKPDPARLRMIRREIRWAEANDARPSSWRLGRQVPRTRLPRGATTRARNVRSRDAHLAARLDAIGHGYRGWAAFWVHDLRTGSWAGWNSDARFPAASTVKLGVLAAALGRYGPRPERSAAWYDLRQLTGWSSNLAANRLVRLVGGERAVERALHRLGARASTYPGPYRAGTALLADAPKPPPHRHWRVTTARDLGRALYALQAAAAGNRWLQRRTGLSRHEATLALGLLVTSSSAGENRGLIRPFVGRAPVAQKNGWLSDTRATAAIVYRVGRPVIVVVLVYRPGVTTAEARRLGSRVVEALPR